MKGKSNIFVWKWTKVLFIAFILTLTLRCFVVESFRMPGPQMEDSIESGDFIFVDKTAYGIRMPLSIPHISFIPDSLVFKGKTYPTFFELPDYQFESKSVKRNEIVVYNIPAIADNPIDRMPVSISRCIGLPGDTIEVSGSDYSINGKKLPGNPDLVLSWTYDEKYDSRVEEAMKKLKIPDRPLTAKTENTTCKHLSRYESYLIECELSDSNLFHPDEKNNLSYKLIIPGKNKIVKLSQETLSEYKQIILKHEKGNAFINDGKLFIKGKETEFYLFKEDYYWLLSDNPEASADSRHFGFIPHSHLIGKAGLIWLSKDPAKGIFEGYRWNRIFNKVQ